MHVKQLNKSNLKYWIHVQCVAACNWLLSGNSPDLQCMDVTVYLYVCISRSIQKRCRHTGVY